MRIKILLIVLSSVGYSQVNAQFTIRGKLTDEEDQPIEYAEVSLKNVNDSTKMSTTATDKNVQKDNLSGNIGSTYTQSTYPKGNLTASLNYKKNKLSSYIILNGTYGSYAPKGVFNYYFPDSLQTKAHLKYVKRDYSKLINARTGIDYQINKKSSVGFQYLGEFSNPYTMENDTITLTNNSIRQIKPQVTTESAKNLSTKLNNLSAYYTIKLDSPGKEINADFDYLHYDKDENWDNESKIFSNKLKKIVEMHIISSKIDATLPIEPFDFSFGGKASFIKTKNRFIYHNTENRNTLNNHFSYKENTQALYVSANKGLNKWNFKLGGRLEITQTKGNSNVFDHYSTNDYENFFPYVSISYKPEKNNSYSLSYKKTINRPSYKSIVPFRWNVNSYFYTEGNYFLKPSITHTIALLNLWKNNLKTRIYLTSIHNQFSLISCLVEGEEGYSFNMNYRNMTNEKAAGLNQSYTLKIFNWLKSYLQYDLNYSKVQSLFPEIVSDNERFNFNFSVNNQLYLTKKWTADVNYLYFSGNSGINYIKGFGSLNMVLKGLLFNKNMTLSIAFNDILKTNKYKFKTKVQNITQVYNNYYDRRQLQISLFYNFGNKKIRSKEKKLINEEEIKRLN